MVGIDDRACSRHVIVAPFSDTRPVFGIENNDFPFGRPIGGLSIAQTANDLVRLNREILETNFGE